MTDQPWLIVPEMRDAPPRRRGHAANPGSGPEDETCGTCRHLARVHYHDKTYRKCGLMKHNWTHGPGSDIRRKDPACRWWEAKS
jgi:hypothetical protein